MNKTATEITAEEFLREKLENEVQTFGDGTTEIHTRDLAHLLKCLDEKDTEIADLKKALDAYFQKNENLPQ